MYLLYTGIYWVKYFKTTMDKDGSWKPEHRGDSSVPVGSKAEKFATEYEVSADFEYVARLMFYINVYYSIIIFKLMFRLYRFKKNVLQ